MYTLLDSKDDSNTYDFLAVQPTPANISKSQIYLATKATKDQTREV